MPSHRVAILVSMALLVGCESANKQMMGMGLGAALCGVGGGAAAKGMGASTTTSVGVGIAAAALCGWAGSEIGKMLDERDRKLHQEAVAKALETGQNQAWSNTQSGASGQIQLKDTSSSPSVTKVSQPTKSSQPQTQPQNTADAPPPPPQTVAQGPLCRTVTQTVTLKDGTMKSEDLTACKGPNGWEVRSWLSIPHFTISTPGEVEITCIVP